MSGQRRQSLDLHGVTSMEQAQRLSKAMAKVSAEFGVSAKQMASAMQRASQTIAAAFEPEKQFRALMAELIESEHGRAEITLSSFHNMERLFTLVEDAERSGLIEADRIVSDMCILVRLTPNGRKLAEESLEAKRIRDIEADKNDVFSDRRSIQLED